MRYLILFLVASFLVSCGGASGQYPVPTPVCRGDICVNQVYLTLENGSVFVQFDLADSDGEVVFGDEPQFTGDITVGLFMPDEDDDIYLWGARVSNSGYVCYSGNDLPWSEGTLASSCGLAIAISQMQVRPEAGDAIKVEIIEFDFSQTVILEESN